MREMNLTWDVVLGYSQRLFGQRYAVVAQRQNGGSGCGRDGGGTALAAKDAATGLMVAAEAVAAAAAAAARGSSRGSSRGSGSGCKAMALARAAATAA